jgi:hypothetical protein
MLKKAPILFFTYKRPDHTRQALQSLAQNEGSQESELFIFCDAPKRAEDEEAVRQVREVIRTQQWCGKVHIIERETNMGCANSIISGVTEICEKYGRVIVLEDDLVLSPFFLDYMNRALDLYEDNPQVMQISGHMFPVNLDVETDAVFLPFSTSWGWATWQRSWKYFDPGMSGYAQLTSNKKLRYKFDLNGSYPYFKMLEEQIDGKIDAWCIRWYLSTFLLGGLTLYPTQSLVSNIGFDGSGTHCGNQSESTNNFSEYRVICFPTNIKANLSQTNTIIKYFRSIKPHPFIQLTIILAKVINKANKVYSKKHELV